MKLLFICHSNYLKDGKISDANYGITFEFFNKYNSEYSVLRHSLYKGGESRLYQKYLNEKYKVFGRVGKLSDIPRYFAELTINFFTLIKYRPPVVVAIDPLCAIIPVLLKKIGFLKKVYFITPDFSEKRFSSAPLNRIYHFIDRICTKSATVNICNSVEVIRYKKKHYKFKDSHFFHMPNLPNPWLIEDLDKTKTPGRVIYVGNISTQLNFKKIFEGIGTVAKKEPSVHLVMIGTGDQEQELRSYIKAKNMSFITIKGQLPYEQALKEIATSEVGIAIYNGSFSFDRFRDSCKIREYQALKVIPLISKVVIANYEEVKKFNSGVIAETSDEIVDSIENIFTNKGFKESIWEGINKNNKHYSEKYMDYVKLIVSK